MTPNSIWNTEAFEGINENQIDVRTLRDIVEKARYQPGTFDGHLRLPVSLGYQLHDLMNAWRRQPERDMSLSAFKDLDFGVLWVSAQRLQGEAREFALGVLADTVPVPIKRMVEVQIAMDNQLKAIQDLADSMSTLTKAMEALHEDMKSYGS